MEEASVSVGDCSSPSPLVGRNIAVLVGINEYGHGVPKLRNAVSDVEAVAQLLRHSHGYQVRTLFVAAPGQTLLFGEDRRGAR